MKVLVTGGNGFAGSYIANYFAVRGHRVVATYRNNIPPQNNSNIKYVRCDLSQEIRIDNEDHFDAIIHTACCRLGNDCPMDLFVRDNIDAARNIIEYANNSGISTIVYFSTRMVYGDITKSDVKELDPSINLGKYGETKRAAETLFMESTRLNTIGLRFPGIIGPNAHDTWLVDVCKKIKNNQKIEVSDFDTTSIVWIDDVANFIEYLIDKSIKGEFFKHKIINLANYTKINNVEIVNLIKEYYGSSSEIEITKAKIATPETPNGLFWLNTDRAKEMGFAPSDPRKIIMAYLESLDKG